MKIATARLKSISPYSQSRYSDMDRPSKEDPLDWEKKTWRERLHYRDDGQVFIPPMAFKKALEGAARFLGISIKGRGKSTYTKHFKAGVLVTDGLMLPIKKDEVPGEWFHVAADGKPGGNSPRVKRCFPVIREWEGDVTFYVLDDTIAPEIFERHLREAGNFIGIGRFRPENGGFYGRFEVKKISWQTDAEELKEAAD